MTGRQRVSLIRALEAGTNLVLALTLIGIVAGLYAMSKPAEGRRQVPSYQPGDRLDGITGLDLTTHDQFLILVLQKRCRSCTESIPFYRTVRAAAGRGLSLIAVMPEPREIAEAHLLANGFQADLVLSVQAIPKVRVTPTLILVQPGGVVERVWTGRLSSERESQVLTALGIRRTRSDGAALPSKPPG